MIHNKFRYLMTLALLITAATGAWAEDWTSGDCTVTLSNGVMTVSGNGAMADYTGVAVLPWRDSRSNITGIVVEEGVTSIAKWAFAGCTNVASVSLPSSLTSIGERAFFNCTNAGFTSIIIPVNVETIGDRAFQGCSKLTKVNIPDKVTSIGANAFYACLSVTSVTIGRSVTSIGEQAFRNCSAMTTLTVKAPSCTLGNYALDLCNNLATISVPSDRVDYYKSAAGWSAYASKIQEIPAGTVFFSDDQIEASFAMPAYDATVNYDIVRDMEDETYPVEFSGLSQKVVVKKKTGTGTYEPVTPLTIQLIDQLAATDAQNIIADAGIKVKVLKGTDNNGTITYDETNTIDYADFLADMQPGLYKMVAEPADATTSPYTGTASLAFEAIAGFPVEIAAQEYVTYYSASDNLTLEENSGAKLYTITGIGETKATATEIPSANKEMPFLVYNPTEETKTFLLIPTDAEINQTYADEFKGTATATTIAASTDAQTNYAFNGKQFVWVRTALPVAANKAWLAIPTSNARAIKLVFDEATTVEGLKNSRIEGFNGDWYTLDGRKLDAAPTRKGVYIVNGKKVVVK